MQRYSFSIVATSFFKFFCTFAAEFQNNRTMASKIKYRIYPNPLPDEKGQTTYQVRHEPDGTMDTKAFLNHLERHNSFDSTAMMSALIVLKNEIVEQLKDNHRFRIDGLGTFQLKVGLKALTDEEGNTVKQSFSNPEAISARNVEVKGISFIPDKSIVDKLKKGVSTVNEAGRGVVGRSKQYERQEVINILNAYLAEHHFITRTTFRQLLGLTSYAAQKWLDQLTSEEFPKYVMQKEGNAFVYRRFGEH